MLTVRDYDRADLESLWEDARFEDRCEWFAGTGGSLYSVAAESIHKESVARVALWDDVPIVAWGGTGGQIWLFATTFASRKALSLHRVLHKELGYMEDRWGLLYCFADNRNTEHHRWLRWLGFTAISEVDLHPFGLPFTLYTKDNSED